MKKNKGFTMMELLIVVAIIGILGAIAIVTFNARVTEARQRTDNENLKTLCSTAVSEYMLEKETEEKSYYTDNANADYDGETKFDGTVFPWSKGDKIGVKVDSAVVTAVGKIG